MEEKLKRAAAYVRVSTETDTQDGSYEMQTEYYKKLITSDPTLEFAGIYGDRKSGRYMKDRPELQRLLRDCRSGKVHMIFCKSISRFARNMRECVATVRKLKTYGVSVRFERDGIDTDTMQGEFIFSIMAAIAAEESNSISQNLKGARNRALQTGRLWHQPRYGFKHNSQKDWIISEPEASHVRKIFRLAAKGTPYTDIARDMNALEEMEGSGRKWTHSMIVGVLRSETYIGDYESCKIIKVTEKDGTVRRVRNEGQAEQIYIEDHHPAIVGRELFKVVGEIVERGLLRANHLYLTEEENDLIQYATELSCKLDFEPQ